MKRMPSHLSYAALPACALALSGCGGTSAFVGPAPHVEAPPPPPPVEPALVWAEPFEVDESQSLAVLTRSGSETEISLRYDADRDRWLLSYPRAEDAGLRLYTEDDQWFYELADAETGAVLPDHYVDMVEPDGRLQYVRSGLLTDETDYFAYFLAAIPTAADDVPVTGTATYDILGHGAYTDIAGEMSFDFAAGSLAGLFEVIYNDGWYEPYSLGDFTMVDTVFGVGSTHFSGGLSHEGYEGSAGSFTGLFAGPGAAELIGRYELLLRDLYVVGDTATVDGLFTGVR